MDLNYEEKLESEEASFDETTMATSTTKKKERRLRNLSKLSVFFKTFEHHDSLSMLCLDEVCERVIRMKSIECSQANYTKWNSWVFWVVNMVKDVSDPRLVSTFSNKSLLIAQAWVNCQSLNLLSLAQNIHIIPFIPKIRVNHWQICFSCKINTKFLSFIFIISLSPALLQTCRLVCSKHKFQI